MLFIVSVQYSGIQCIIYSTVFLVSITTDFSCSKIEVSEISDDKQCSLRCDVTILRREVGDVSGLNQSRPELITTAGSFQQQPGSHVIPGAGSETQKPIY